MFGILTWEQSPARWYQRAEALFFSVRAYSGFGNVYYNRFHLRWDKAMSGRRQKKVAALLGQQVRECGLTYWLVQPGFPLEQALAGWGVNHYGCRQLREQMWKRGVQQLLDQKLLPGRMAAVWDPELRWLDVERALWLAGHFQSLAVATGREEKLEQLGEELMEQQGVPLVRIQPKSLGCAELILATEELPGKWPARGVLFSVGEKPVERMVNDFSFQMAEEQRRCIPQGISQVDYLGLLWQEYGIQDAGLLPVSCYLVDGRRYPVPPGLRPDGERMGDGAQMEAKS